VLAKMRELPVRDAFTDNGVLREDGRMVHSMFLLEVKKPEESKGRGITTSCSPKSPATRRSGR
jgi:hypothetical protein